MQKVLPVVLLFIGLCSDMAFGQSTAHSFTFGGHTRNYRVYLPTNFNSSTSLPLVVDMHGLGSNSLAQELYSEFDNVADTGRCVVVYPDGINNQWNVVIGCTGSTTPCTGIDDVGFISALIDTMRANYNIDLGRVYATGMSDGGYMTFRLACELSCRIAAAASVTGLLQEAYPLYPACNPTRKMPMMQFHGTADSTVKYSGNNPYVATVSSTTTRWITIDGCPSSPTVTNLPDINSTDSSTAVENYYGLCTDSTLFIQYTINGGGHTWPGAIPEPTLGPTNQDISATNLIWNFFKQYSTPANVSISGLANTYCNNAAPVTLSGSPAGGVFSGAGVSGTQFSPTTAGAGVHTVTYSTTWRGCTYSNTQTSSVSACDAIETPTMITQFVVYPNPAGNVIHVQFSLNTSLAAIITVCDITGRQMLQVPVNNKANGSVDLNTGDLAGGFYTVKLSGQNFMAVQKVWKQ